MSSWGKDDDKEFMAGIMALLSGGEQVGPGRGALKAAPKKRGRTHDASMDTSGEFSFEDTFGTRLSDSLDSSPEPKFRGTFDGSGEGDANDFEGLASTLQQDLEREMTKKTKAKTASIAAQSKKCTEMIKTEAAWFEREIEALRQKDNKENGMFAQQALALQQESDKYFRHWSKLEDSLKKAFEASIAEEARMLQHTREKVAKLLSKVEPFVQNLRSKVKGVLAEKKQKEAELEVILEAKQKLGQKIVLKVQQMENYK